MHHRSTSSLRRFLCHNPHLRLQNTGAASRERGGWQSRCPASRSSQRRWLETGVTYEPYDDWAHHTNTDDNLLNEFDIAHRSSQDERQREQQAKALVDVQRSWNAAQEKLASGIVTRVDYANKLQEALRRSEPDLATQCLLAANDAGDTGFIRSISDEMFSRILELTSPQNWLAGLIDLHLSMGSNEINYFGWMPIEDVAEECGSINAKLVEIRRQHGGQLQLSDYETVLRGAGMLHLGPLADRVRAWIESDGLSFTTNCYNLYVAAKLYTRPINILTSRQDRVTPGSTRQRSEQKLPWYHDYATGPDGVLAMVERLFADMQRLDLEPDAESYHIILRACALEGDIDGVINVLNKIWGIDVISLQQGEITTNIADVDAGQAFSPDKKLLYEASRAFLINNDFPTAYRLMDYLCKSHQVEADIQQWQMMVQWAHVLSVPKSEASIQRAGVDGRIEPDVLISLWRTMIMPPYSIKPNLTMYAYLIRNLKNLAAEPAPRAMLLAAMEEAREVFKQECKQSRMTTDKLMKLRKENTRSSSGDQQEQEGSSATHPIECLSREVDLMRLRRISGRDTVVGGLQYFLGSATEFAETDYDARLTAVDIPTVIGEWLNASNSTVKYAIPTGYVELQLRSKEEKEKNKAVAAARVSQHQGITDGRRIDVKWFNGAGAYHRAFATDFAHARTGKLDLLSKQHRGYLRPEDLPALSELSKYDLDATQPMKVMGMIFAKRRALQRRGETIRDSESW